MIKVTLKDGSVKVFEQGVTVLGVAESLSSGLARVACAVKGARRCSLKIARKQY